MIDVPVEVKDALREGTYKKNYRFVVTYDEWVDAGSFTTIRYSPLSNAGQGEKYIIKDNRKYRFVIDDANFNGYTFYYRNNNYGSWSTLSPIDRNTWELTGTGWNEIEISDYNGTVSYHSQVIVTKYIDTFTIDNDNLVSESVSIDERMCSGDTLKFGLCEGSSLEFQYFGKPNITGKRVQAFVDVQYLAGTVGRINANSSFRAPVNGSYTFELKKGSATGLYITFAGGGDMYVDFVLGQTTDTEELEAGDVVTLNNPSSNALFEVSADMWDTIPMGFFDVKKCSRQASTGIIKATCYNKLQSDYLDAKANNVLFDSFTEATDVTIFDIQSILLNDYQIYQTEKDRAMPTQSAILTSRVSLGDYHFTKQYGVDSFLNPCLFPEYATDGFGLTLGIMQPQLSGLNSRIDARYGSLVQLEQIFVNYLRDLIDGAELDVSFDTVLNNICANTGFEQCFGVWAQQEGVPITVKTYSTIQWNYEEAHGLTHTVDGTLQDIAKLEDHSNLRLYIPKRIDVYNYGVHNTLYTHGYLVFSDEYYTDDWHTSYKYYLDAQQTQKTGYVKPLIFSDGTPYERSDENSDSLFWLWRYTNIANSDLITVNTETIPEFTLRDIVSASYETQCEFGQLSRVTDLFSGVELNHSRLYPADSLYPATDLYPSGAVASGFRSMYSKLWADEGNVHKWRYLIITYKGLNGDNQEEDFTLQRTVNADGTDDYNMSDNWLFRNLVWTASQVGEYADAMVTKMQDITWFPFEMWCAGLPYLETGDEIEITLGEETYTSYILQRQLKGIQNLQDTYINGTLDIF